MAEEADDVSWRAGCAGWAILLVVLSGIMFLWIAIDERDFDPHDICAPGETGECIATGTGVVTSDAISWQDVRVAYEDGTKTVDVLIDQEEGPASGTRVLLEWWDGDVVAVVDRESGRRYETSQWPDPWWEWLAVWGVTAAMAGVALAAVFGTVAGVQRLRRRRQAASSNGKPCRSRRRSKSRR